MIITKSNVVLQWRQRVQSESSPHVRWPRCTTAVTDSESNRIHIRPRDVDRHCNMYAPHTQPRRVLTRGQGYRNTAGTRLRQWGKWKWPLTCSWKARKLSCKLGKMDSVWIGKDDEVSRNPGEGNKHRLGMGHSGTQTWNQEKYGLTVVLNCPSASDQPEEFF